MRTDQEIVDQTNKLAHRMLAEGVGTGYVHAEGESFKIYEHLDENPRFHRAWALACAAQEILTATDPNDALSALEPEEEEVELDYIVTLVETVKYTVRVKAADSDQAGEYAASVWANSEDPTKDFEGSGEGVEVEGVRQADE